MKGFLLTTFALFFAIGLFAQDVTVPNVSDKMKKYRGVESIEGLGYFCFVVDEKSKKGYKVFKLYIWDYEMNEIAVPKIELEKKSIIMDAVFNGNNFLVAFYDSRRNNVRTVAFDKTGKKVADLVEDGMKTAYMLIEDMQPSYYPAGDQGFYGIIPEKDKKFGFTVKKVTNDLKVVWSKKYFPEKGMQVVLDAKSDGNKLILLKYSKDKKFSKILDVDLTAFGTVDGEEMWTYDLNTDGKVLMPMELDINEKGETAVAGMYFDGDKIKGGNSDGIFFSHVDNSGDQLSLTTQPWDGELQDFVKESKNSFTAGKPKVIFEDIIYNASTGEYKLVGEIYTVAALGKALAMLSGESDAESRVTLEDIVVFTFSSEGKLVDFYAINKTKTNIMIPAAWAGGVRISWALKSTGSLPIKYTALDENGDAVVFFIDGAKVDENGSLVNSEGKKLFNGSNNLAVGMLNLNKSSAQNTELKYLPLSRKAAKNDEDSDIEYDSKTRVVQITESKPGFILISDLKKKANSLNIWLEEIK
ncbi:MAG: DUF6770 family protein [Chitinophagales bacterium]